MSVAEIVADLARRGIRLEADGERLRYHPRSALTPDLLARLEAHKAELMAILYGPVDPSAAADASNDWDWWGQVKAGDRAYLLGPRNWPEPCPWCGGRLRHNPLCDELRESWGLRMPFGKYKRQPIAKVPREYLEWLLNSSDSLGEELREEISRMLGDAAPAKPACRCDPADRRDVPIHGGQSVRQECGRCGRFLDFPVWHGIEICLLTTLVGTSIICMYGLYV